MLFSKSSAPAGKRGAKAKEEEASACKAPPSLQVAMADVSQSA